VGGGGERGGRAHVSEDGRDVELHCRRRAEVAGRKGRVVGGAAVGTRAERRGLQLQTVSYLGTNPQPIIHVFPTSSADASRTRIVSYRCASHSATLDMSI
jgi:hypothetical protein